MTFRAVQLTFEEINPCERWWNRTMQPVAKNPSFEEERDHERV